MGGVTYVLKWLQAASTYLVMTPHYIEAPANCVPFQSSCLLSSNWEFIYLFIYLFFYNSFAIMQGYKKKQTIANVM